MCDHRHLSSSYSPGEIEHVNFLSEDIGNLFLNEDCSDIILVVGGQKFPAHKVILASRCDYFRALLFGGMSESQPGVNTIELQDERPQAFSVLLSYIYTGKVRLSQLKEELMLDLLGMSNKYGFQLLESAISEYLKVSLSLKNVCVIYDMASIYILEKLSQHCLNYMDRHASQVLQSDGFLSMSKNSLVEVIQRSSFCANEIEIFEAAVKWSSRNSAENISEIIQQIRFPLMSLNELLSKVRPSELVNPNDLLNAIDQQIHSKDTDLNYRGVMLPEENVASLRHDAAVIKGEMKATLLDGDVANYDLDRGFTRHGIDDEDSEGIVVRLGQPAILNTIKLLLWDKDARSYAYYVDVSMNGKDWVRVVDHSKYLCRSWQVLHFDQRVVKFIKIVGTHNTVNRVFHLVALEALYTLSTFKLQGGLIAPTENVATVDHSAVVVEGVARTRNSLINGDLKNYDWDSGYTCHQLGSGAIIVQLGQPYMLDCMTLLLWDCDDRTYSYTVEVSVDNTNWVMIQDNRNKACRSWQNIRFPPRPVTFIKIVGTNNSANEVFHLVHFECPSERQRDEQRVARRSVNSPSDTPGAAGTSSTSENASPLGSHTSTPLVDLAPPTSPSSQFAGSAISEHRIFRLSHRSTLSRLQSQTSRSEPLVELSASKDSDVWADLAED